MKPGPRSKTETLNELDKNSKKLLFYPTFDNSMYTPNNQKHSSYNDKT